VLRLVTGDSTAETQVSGARAGRGDVELPLPEVPTVSREHARFTYADGQWWVTNLGRNGLTLNGVPLAGRRSVRDGDSIRWGSKADALVSRVEVR
jgi:pSer/pThr/pTyr-binding forkhead associated (FHA) protein